jgi:RNA polymerase sigma-70 factor, ECF subfamily
MKRIVSIFSRRDQWVETLIAPHFPALYSQAYKYTANRAAAQDLVQDVLVYALENKRKVLELDPVLPWLMRCLYHRFVDHFRKHRNDFECRDDGVVEQLATRECSAEDQYFHTQVRDSLKRLSLEQKVAVTLFDIEGYSLEEVCQVMELPIGTVKSHLHRGRRRLKILLGLSGNELQQHDTEAHPATLVTGGTLHEL